MPSPSIATSLRTFSGIDAGVAQRDHAAERMRDDRHRRQLLLMDQLREVVDIGGDRIAAVGRPLAVAVTAQIGRQDVPVVAQRLRHPVPVAAMVAPAMHQQQRRRAGIAPIDVMQPQPLREIDARGRAGAVFVGRLLSWPAPGLLDGDWALYDKTPARIRGVSGGPLCEAILRTRHRSRAKSWTWRSVADAKGSATGARPVESCP